MGVVRPINDAVKMKATARMIRIAYQVLYVVLKTARKDSASLIELIAVSSFLMSSTQVTKFYIAIVVNPFVKICYTFLSLILHFFVVYGFRKNLHKGCEEQKDRQFSEISDARQACRTNKNCSGVYDIACGANQTFHLCLHAEAILHQSESSCVHDKIILGMYL